MVENIISLFNFFTFVIEKPSYICTRNRTGEMAEWSNALVLKTSEGNTSGGSNPSFSAKENRNFMFRFFYAKN